MPYYDYHCDECGEFEIFQSIIEPVLLDCPKCNELGLKKPIKRLISRSSFILKGGGWGNEGYK